MTGQELFYALSFVDERYIAEAEKAWVSGGIPWRKVLSVAACLCILIAGAFALRNFGYMGATEEAAAPPAAAEPEAAAPMEAITESAMEEGAPTMAQDETEEAAGEPATIPGELHHVAFAQVRVLEVLEDGSFRVFVERVAEEPGPIEAGETLTLVIDPGMIPAADRTELEYSGDIAVDMLVEIQNGAYDAGIHTLYAEGVLAAARE